MKKRNQMVSILLTLVMVSALFTGCGQKQEEASDTAKGSVESSVESKTQEVAEESQAEQEEVSYRISEEPITITVAGYASNSNNDWNSTVQFQQYEEQLGIKLAATTYTSEQWSSKLTLMMASDEMPDMLASAKLTADQVAEYGSDGYFLDLAEYLDIMPNLSAYMEKYPEYASALKDDEGHIYALSAINESPENYLFYATYMNQTWLDNLGLEKPTTLDELYNVLVAFRDEDADGDGDPDNEIPFGYQGDAWYHAEYPILWGHGIYVRTTDGEYHMMVDENNQVYLANATENYKDFLKYMHKLYDEKLINEDAYVITRDELLQRFANETIGTMFTTRELPLLAATGDSEADNLAKVKKWIIIGGLQDETYSPEGKIVLNGRTSGCNWAVNADTKYPEEICKFLDYLYTDEGALSSAGLFEGITCDMKDFFGATIVDTEPYQDQFGEDFQASTCAINAFLIRSTQKFSTLGAVTSISADDLYSDTCAALAGTSVIKERLIREYEGNVINGYPPLVYTPEEKTEMATLKTDLLNYIKTEKAQFIVGEQDIDANWDEYLAKLDEMGLERLLEIEQAAYDRYLAK